MKRYSISSILIVGIHNAFTYQYQYQLVSLILPPVLEFSELSLHNIQPNN